MGRGVVFQVVLLVGVTILAPAAVLAAGSVTVTVKNDVLVISGDEHSNSILISKPRFPAPPGPYQVEQNDGSTLVNGSLDPVSLAATKGIEADLGGGDDAIGIWGSDVPGSVSVGIAEGGLMIVDSTLFGNLSFRTGDGHDGLFVNDAWIQGKVDFRAGDGDSITDISVGVIDGDLTIAAGDGEDSVSLFESYVRGGVSVKAGDGPTRMRVSEGALLREGLRFKSRAGLDDVRIASSEVRGADFDFGNGPSVVVITKASDIVGNLRVCSRSGYDSLALEDAVVVQGNVQMSSKGGGLIASFAAEIQGHLQLKHGERGDVVGFGTNGTVRFGPGGSVQGKTTIQNGAGTSVFGCASHPFVGDVKIRTKGGYAQARIEDCDFDRSLVVVAGRDGGSLIANQGGGFTNIGGSLSFSLKDALGEVGLWNLSVNDKTKIRMGGGFSHGVRIDDSSFAGAVTIQTGKGNDQIAVETQTSPAGPDTLFESKLKISTGAGDDVIRVGAVGSAADVDFMDKVTYDGGKGDDIAYQLTYGNAYAVPPRVKGIETES
jgi:hypothetical protein